jgi:hypothetical protein
VQAPASSYCAPRGRLSPSGGAGAMTMWELQNLSASPVSDLGREIVDFGVLHGSFLSQNPLEKVGGFASHLFQ